MLIKNKYIYAIRCPNTVIRDIPRFGHSGIYLDNVNRLLESTSFECAEL